MTGSLKLWKKTPTNLLTDTVVDNEKGRTLFRPADSLEISARFVH